MHSSALFGLVLLASTILASPLVGRHNEDDEESNIRIFKKSNERWEGAICKEKVTKHKFPSLVAPSDNGGCVRYYQGIDMTGVVTEVDLYSKDGIYSACDCIVQCLTHATTCTNWVFKHTFNAKLDGGKRTCTLYSSPNLPFGVTLAYNLTGSSGFQLLQDANNPQVGALAPLTFEDKELTKQDPFGVSGFISQDQNLKLYC